MFSKLPTVFIFVWFNKSYREVPAIEGVDDEGLVAEVDDAGHPVASLQGCHGAGDELSTLPVLHHPVVVTLLNILIP